MPPEPVRRTPPAPTRGRDANRHYRVARRLNQPSLAAWQPAERNRAGALRLPFGAPRPGATAAAAADNPLSRRYTLFRRRAAGPDSPPLARLPGITSMSLNK